MNKTLAVALVMASTFALADVQHQEVPVLDVEPIKTVVHVVEPQEHCWFEDVREHSPSARPSAVPSLVGAVVGGAVGNAVGHKKRNKQVGTVVGALLGASIAEDISRGGRDRDARLVRTTRQEICETRESTRTEERVSGYFVTYAVAGQTYRSRVDRRPGETIRVRVRVTPI